MTDSPSFDENPQVQMSDDDVHSHENSTDEPADFVNDAVSGSESTDPPVIEGDDAAQSTPSPDQV